MDRRAVLIIGGGPAGLATAIEISRLGISTAVIERSGYQDIRVGEHVPPSAVLSLRALACSSGLPLYAHAVSAGVEAYWGSETPNYMDYFCHPGQHGLNLSRPEFDRDLAQACERSGAEVLRLATLMRAERVKSGWDVKIAVGGGIRNWVAAMIVDATGRAASFARSEGAKLCSHDRQVAIVAFEDESERGANARSLVESVDNGWWYSAPIGPRRSVCMLITDDDLLPRGGQSDLHRWWLDQRSRTIHLAPRYPSCVNRLVVRSARSQRVEPGCGAGWLAVGDAAMAFDPMASQGIGKALDHAKRTAADIVSYFTGDGSLMERVRLKLEAEYDVYRAMRASYYRIEKRWPQSIFWRRRHENTERSQRGPKL